MSDDVELYYSYTLEQYFFMLRILTLWIPEYIIYV